MPSTPSRRLALGVAAAASLVCVPTAFATTTYDLTASGTVQYLRKDFFGDGISSAAIQQQAAFKFTTTVTGLELDVNHNLKSPGTPATTISDVTGAYRTTITSDAGSVNGACSATQGKVVVPGALGEPFLAPLVGEDYALRVFNHVDIPMSACTGATTGADDHVLPITHWGEPVGESALDTLVKLSESDFQGDVSTGELQAAAPAGRCPAQVEGFTVSCSIAIQGQWTLTKTGAEVPPKPKPPEGPTGTPRPIGGSGGKMTGSASLAGDGKRVKVRVSCSQACRGAVSITLPGGGAQIGAPVQVDLAAGKSRTVSFRVNPAQRKALVSARRVNVRFQATAGETPTATQKVPVTRGR